MPITKLALTDGTTTADLTDNANYALVSNGWSPSIAQLRAGELGGYGPYEDVAELITVDITSAQQTNAATLENLLKLQQLVEQARRWQLGASVSAVRLQYAINNGSIRESAIKGGSVQLPSNYADMLTVSEIESVALSLIRQGGLWLNPTPEFSNAVTATANQLTTLLFSMNPRTASPTGLTISHNNGTNNASLMNGLVLIGPPNSIVVLEAESSGQSTYASVITDTASNASGGAVLRLLFPTEYGNIVGIDVPDTFTPQSQLVDVFLTVRVNGSGTPTKDIFGSLSHLQLIEPGNTTINVPLAGRTWSANGMWRPMIQYLGRIAVPNGVTKVGMQFYLNFANGVTGVDIDQIILAAVTPDSHSLALLSTDYSTLFPGGLTTLRIDPQPLSAPNPLVEVSVVGGQRVRPAYGGNAAFHSRTTQMQAVFLSTAGTLFRPGSANAPISYTFQASRYNATLIPA